MVSFHTVTDLSANIISAGKNSETLEDSRKLACLNGWGQHDKIIISHKVSALRLCDLLDEYLAAELREYFTVCPILTTCLSN